MCKIQENKISIVSYTGINRKPGEKLTWISVQADIAQVPEYE